MHGTHATSAGATPSTQPGQPISSPTHGRSTPSGVLCRCSPAFECIWQDTQHDSRSGARVTSNNSKSNVRTKRQECSHIVAQKTLNYFFLTQTAFFSPSRLQPTRHAPSMIRLPLTISTRVGTMPTQRMLVLMCPTRCWLSAATTTVGTASHNRVTINRIKATCPM